MSNDQTFQIIASPRERWYLALFLLNGDLKFKGKRATALWRFRCALGLVGPTEGRLTDGAGTVALALDRTTRNVFTVTKERAEFLDDCIEQVDSNGGQLAMFQRVLAQLQDGKPSGDTEGVAPFDETKEDWAPTLAPKVEEPGALVEVMLDCIKRAKQGPDAPYDFSVFAELFTEEATPTKGTAKPPLRAEA